MKTLRILPALFLGAALTACPTAPKPDPIPPSPKVVSFTASPATVAPGGEVTLDWKVTDATKVTITDVDKGDLSGVDDQLSGSVKVVPTASTLYVLTALNERGAKATAFVSVTVKGADADKLLFAAYPPIITENQPVSLIWSAPGANVVTITPSGGTAIDLMGQVQSGSVSVHPTDTETTYTLNADGQTRTVTVTHAPAISELTLSKPVAEVDDMVTVTWKTEHATKATLSSPGFGTLFETTTAGEVAMGSYSQAVPSLPTGTVLNFVLDVEGAGGSSRQVSALVVGKGPVLTEATAPRYVKSGSTFTVAWKAANADAVEVRTGGTAIYRTTDFSQVATGSVSLPSPAMGMTYTVAAVALPSGLAATKDVTVEPVGAVTITTFTATPTTVANGGDAVTLTWNVPNARELRIEQDNELTVVWKTGTTAETGTATVYPNRATSTFTLTATNTLDPSETATAEVTVTTVGELRAADGGVVFERPGSVDVALPFGTEIHGLPLPTPTFNTASTGFDDIAMTGTKLDFPSADNAYVQFAVPGFETWLYGTRLARTGNISVCTNGFLTLRAGTLTTATPPSTFPGTSTTYDNLLAPFWADLELGTNGAVYWQVKGEAPNQVLIVQWDKVQLKGTPTSVLTFQAQVTQAGVITFEYQTLDNLPTTYTSASGLQGSAGRGQTGTAAAGGSLRFFGPIPAPASVPSDALPISGFVKIGNGFARASLSRFVRATDISITEVMFASTAPFGEWFEVANNSTAALDLGGWEIDFGGGTTHTITGSVPLPAGGVIVLGQSNVPSENDGVTVAYAYGTSLLLADGPGQVALKSGGATVASRSWTGTVGSAGNALNVDGRPVLLSTGLGTLECTSSATFGTQVPQQTGTPGTLTSCFGYVLTNIPVDFDDLSTTGGTPLFNASANPDWTTAPAAFDLPTPFPYFGVSQPRVWVSPSSWLAFTTQSSAVYTNRTTPSLTSQPVGAVAPFWDDTENIPSVTGSNVFWARRSNHTVVHWSHFTHWLESDDLNYQVKLFDNGVIEFHYGTMTSSTSDNYGDGNDATIWIERPSGTASALPIGVNQAVISPNTAYRYTPTP